MSFSRCDFGRRALLRLGLAFSIALSLQFGSLQYVGSAAAQDSSTVRIAIPLGFRGLDPHEGVNPRAEVTLQSNIYSSLTRITPELEVVGDLATQWEQPEPLIWEFELNPAARFENGTPLDADEIVANFSRMFDAELGFTFAADLKPVIKSVEAVTPTRVRFTLSSPYPDFLRRMSYIYFLDTEWAKSHNPKLEANASGPYRLVSFDPEAGAVLEANPDYYGEQPAFSNAEMKVLRSPAQRLTGLLAGEVDVATILDPQDLKQIEATGEFKVGAIDSSRSVYLWYNTTKEPFDNKLVRQALNYAVNVPQITETLLSGYGKALEGQVFSPIYTGYNPDLKAYPYDPEKAKALLAEAGYPNGFTTTMSVPTGAYVAGDQIAQVVAAQLAQIGVKVNIEQMPMQTMTQQGNNPETAAPMRFVGYAAYDMSARGFLIYFRSAGASNQAKDPGYDKLYEAYLNAETDEEKAKLVAEITEYMRDFAPMLFLYSQPTTYAVRNSVEWTPRPDDWLRAFDMTPVAN